MPAHRRRPVLAAMLVAALTTACAQPAPAGPPVAAGGCSTRPAGAGHLARPAPAPISARAPVASAWTGPELLAWDYELRAAAYDPGQDRWAAVVAAGPVFLFAGAHAGPAGTGPGRLLAYNPG